MYDTLTVQTFTRYLAFVRRGDTRVIRLSPTTELVVSRQAENGLLDWFYDSGGGPARGGTRTKHFYGSDHECARWSLWCVR